MRPPDLEPLPQGEGGPFWRPSVPTGAVVNCLVGLREVSGTHLPGRRRRHLTQKSPPDWGLRHHAPLSESLSCPRIDKQEAARFGRRRTMIQRSNLKGTLQLLGAMVFFSICYFTGRGHVGLSLLDLPGGFPRRSPKENAMQKQLEEISEGLHDMMSRHHLHPTFAQPAPLLAISIQTSNGQLDNLERLLMALKHPRVAVIIHMDEKARHHEHEKLDRIVRNFRKLPNTFHTISTLAPTQQITYRGVVMVDVTLRIMETFVRQVKGWRFFINISAVDYLLLRVEELLEIISNVPGDANFVGAEHRRHLSLIFGRVTNVVLDEALFRSDPYWRVNATSPFRRLYPTLFRPYHGEAWMILSRRFCTYVTESTDGLPRRMFAYYANIISAPEGYFHTLICASEFASTLVADSLRYVDWSTPRQHPPDISSRHIPLLETKGAVFARKVVDFEVIAEIDERLRRTVPAGKHRSSITAAWVSQRIGRALLPENRGCDKVEVNQTEANFLGSGPFHGYDLSLLDDYPANPGVDNRGPNASDAYAFRGGQENFQSL